MREGQPHTGLYYQHFIARLSDERDVENYLEVGVQNGLNLSQVTAQHAFGVDPEFAISIDVTRNKDRVSLFRTTSDRFFSDQSNAIVEAGRLDLVFLDGMHLFEYLLRDFYNTEAISKASSVIMLHDCLPFDGEMIERVNRHAERTPGPYAGAWTGDVWKVVPLLKKFRPDLCIRLLDCEPTGLVCISDLDPSSTLLKSNYLAIVEEFHRLPNDWASVSTMYEAAELVSAESVLRDHSQSLLFRV